jgi:hypothetical protein
VGRGWIYTGKNWLNGRRLKGGFHFQYEQTAAAAAKLADQLYF